jgi:hypothetical protein
MHAGMNIVPAQRKITTALRLRTLVETIREEIEARGFYIVDKEECKLVWGKSKQVRLRLANIRAFAQENNWHVDIRQEATMARFTPGTKAYPWNWS